MKSYLVKKISLLLSILMLINMLPLNAYAAEAHPGMITIQSGQSVGDGSYINHNDSGYPFKMNFTLDENTMPLQSCRLGISSWDCDEDSTGSTREWDQVYVNDTCVGVLTGQNQLWKTSYFEVPLSALHMGNNTIIIYVGHMDNATGATVTHTNQWLLKVQQAVLQFDGGKDANAPETFKLELTSATETATGISCTANAQIQSTQVHSYVIEYSLVDLSINQIVADDEENVSGTNISSTGHFYLPADAPRGNYRIEATLRDDITSQVYATAVYNFNLQTVLEGSCKHEGVGGREYVTTNYYKFERSSSQYAEKHKKLDTYSRMCRLCNKEFYEYVVTEENHTLPVCVCGFVEEGFNTIYSAKLAPLGNCVAGGQFKVEIVTHSLVTRVTAMNNVGAELNETKWVVKDNADGTRTFSRVYKADLAATNRYWVIKAYNANGRYLNELQTNSITILPEGEEYYMPLEVAVNAQIQILETMQAKLTATADIIGGSGNVACSWSVVKPDGTIDARDNTTKEILAYYDYRKNDILQLCVTVTDRVTGETVTVAQDITMQCAHTENGESSLIRQKDAVMSGDEEGHMLAYVDVCTICKEEIVTPWRGEKDPHFFTSDDNGKLTCSECQYTVTPASFAEAANIVGSPAYRIYHEAVFPLHSPDGLFRSTASSVIEHRVNDKFLVYLEESYDVLDNEDFAEVESAMQEQIVYEILQDLLCERADETMQTAIGINQEMMDKESVADAIGGLVADELIDAGWEKLGLNEAEKAYGNLCSGAVLSAIGIMKESAKIINATAEEKAKIAFCLAMNEETERALRTLREEMDSSYTPIIDELIERNQKNLNEAMKSEWWDAAELIIKLTGETIIEYGVFTEVPAVIGIIIEATHQNYLQAFRSKTTSVVEVCKKMKTYSYWKQVAEGVDIVASIMVGIEIGHALTGDADQLLYAQDQLMMILPHEVTAYSNMCDAYYGQDDELYAITCVYLETLKQGYSSAKVLYDSHDTGFAKLWESAEETEACIKLSRECGQKMDKIDNYLQLLNLERRKYGE